MHTYPLRPVITKNAGLSKLYDDHPESIAMVSSCLSVEQALNLIKGGASFEAVVVTDDASRRIAEAAPDVQVIQVEDAGEATLGRIHACLKQTMSRGVVASKSGTRFYDAG